MKKELTNKKLSKDIFYVRNASEADVVAMCKLDSNVSRDTRNHVSANILTSWIKQYPDGIFVMTDQEDRQVYGRACCLPLNPDIQVEQVKKIPNSPSFFDFITSKILPSKDAGEKALYGGNLCFIGMLAVNPKKQNEEYYGHAIPLFLKLLSQFYTLRMREIIVRTSSDTAQRVVSYAGAEPICTLSDSSSTIWHFDGKLAAEKVASGLSVVYYTMWGIGTSSGKLDLTPAEKQIAFLLLRTEYTARKRLAKKLNIKLNTVKAHLRNIYQKAEKVKVLTGHGDNMAELIKYLMINPDVCVVNPNISKKQE